MSTTMWPIYKTDKNKFVLQPVISKSLDAPPVRYPFRCVSDDLSSLRMPLIAMGLTKIGRQLGDPKEIVETWG